MLGWYCSSNPADETVMGLVSRLAAASKPGGSPMDAQVGGAPVAPEAIKAASDAAKSSPTSFAPSAGGAAPMKPAAGQQAAQRTGPSAAAPGQPKAQPTASTPSAAELDKAAEQSRISQGAAARYIGYFIWCTTSGLPIITNYANLPTTDRETDGSQVQHFDGAMTQWRSQA